MVFVILLLLLLFAAVDDDDAVAYAVLSFLSPVTSVSSKAK